MDDGFWFICGTVPIILHWWHGPDPEPGPWPWLTFIAAGLGGILAMTIFGHQYAADGTVLPTFLVALSGGAFLGQAAHLAAGMMRGGRQVRA
jgi:hypothetical protein